MLSQMTYILLDAARMGEVIDEAKQLNPEHDSLYRGRSEESLAVVAPYIFTFQHKPSFGDWYMQKGWGDAWGILVKSSYPMADLHKHFRKFLIVGTEDNQQLYFRFYDPRVLRIFLPTCDMAQLREFFGPIDYFVMEDADPGYAIKCWLMNGILQSQKIKVEDFKRPGAAMPATQKPAEQQATPQAQPPTATPAAPATPPPPADSVDEPQVKKPFKPKWNMFD